jgi:4-hydroxybenzoate polyprenyltransferase
MSRIRDIVEALKLEHTIFALPFAYMGVWVAARGNPSWHAVLWVTLAMIGGRTAGMAANRLIDRKIDRMNPRTQNWPTSAGKVKKPVLIIAFVVGVLLLFEAASRLNPLCLQLAPIALFLLVVYPSLKRFTWACHFGLGMVLGAAPVGGWLAVTGAWDPAVLPLFFGVLFWVAGFDILYALLDLDFDRQHGVYSIPQRFGLQRALTASRLCHIIAVICFMSFGFRAGQGFWYSIGLAVVAALLLYEHLLVGPGRLDRINKAFFTVNGWVSVSFFFFTWIGLKAGS